MNDPSKDDCLRIVRTVKQAKGKGMQIVEALAAYPLLRDNEESARFAWSHVAPEANA